GTGVRAKEQLFVGPLEVQQQAQRLTHADVLEHRLAQVEDEALHALRVAVGDFLLDQPAFAHGGNVVGRGPVLGGHLLPEIESPGFQRFERNGVVA
nr:hypothetical protein [Tanacetum cinerariifolium]